MFPGRPVDLALIGDGRVRIAKNLNNLVFVDARRTVAMAISPYTRRKFVDSTYNQTGMVKTIELILGLPPMNRLDLSATPMRNCFQTEPDTRPYRFSPNKIAL